MAVEISDFVNVEERAVALGIAPPPSFCILPRNFETASAVKDLIYEGSADTVRKLLRESGIEDIHLRREEIPYRFYIQNAFEWVGPTLFFGATVLSQNPYLIELSLNILANYLTDFFKGVPGQKSAKLDIVLEKKPKSAYVRLRYRGPVEGIRELTQTIKTLKKAGGDE